MRVDSMPLAALAEVRSGGGAPQDSRAFTASGHPFVRAGSLSKLLGGASEDSLEHLDPDMASQHGLRLFPSGTVLFAKSGMSATKGYVYGLRRPAYVVNHLAALIPRHAADSAFLVRLLERFSPVGLVKDPAYPSIRLGDIENMRVIAPPSRADRLRITDVLDRAETPKDEIDRNTYSLFDLETGVPTDAYSLEEAVRDGFLVPPKAVSVPLKFQREGIKYDELSEDEKDQWDALEWDEEGTVPDRIDAAALNKWLFNTDTVDKVLAHLMTRGLTVAGGDRLGKTIVFAKNQDHADFIADRFNANYPHFRGEFARAITFRTEYAQSLIDDFSNKERSPHIAISVDMLDTGIDIPEVVNLVFFKLVRSKTKFWQMLGRGTRLCSDLFEPGQDKDCFQLFDYCGNLEFFSQNPETTEGAVGDSLGKRLFVTRLELVEELDKRVSAPAGPSAAATVVAPFGDPTTDAGVCGALAASLHREVAAMNLDNFLVRPQRRLVEKYAKAEAWGALSGDAIGELDRGVAGLPAELAAEPEETKRFDLLILNLQLGLLQSDPGFERLRDQVKAIAGLLEEKSAIPMVRAQMSLIGEVQTDEWWVNVTVPMLESVRRRLRDLAKLIEKAKRRVVFADFEDEMGPEERVELPGLAAGWDFEKFRAKAQAFLREHQDHTAIRKLRMNRPLTAGDLAELERMLVESGVGGRAQIDRAKQESHGLGLFVRSLVGLDRGAAKEALAGFLSGKTLAANQIEFVNLIVDHLTEHGVMPAALLYESPFTDITPRGPDGLFASADVDELIATLLRVRATALAA